MARIRSKKCRMLALTIIAIFVFAQTAWAAVPQAPLISPDPGQTYSDSVTVSLTSPTVGAKVYYTDTGDDPKTAGKLYENSFTLYDDATVRAVAYNEDGYSEESLAQFNVVTFRERIEKLEGVLDKLAKLSPAQLEQLIDLASWEINVLWYGDPQLSADQKANLAVYGITAESLQTVITAIEDYVNYNDCDGITGYDGLVYAIQPENRSITYLNGLYVAVSSALPAALKDTLADQGLSADDLVEAVLSLSELNMVQGLALTDELKDQARDIFEQIVAETESITLEKLAENGLTFENLQALINGLSDEDKTFLRSVIWTLGYLGEPEASPSAGTYSDSVKVTLYSETNEASIYYTLDGSDPVDGNNSLRILYTGQFTLTGSTTVKAAAYADGIYSEVVSFTYSIRTFADRLNDLSGVLDKVSKLSPAQLEQLIDLASWEINVLWYGDPQLSADQKANLAVYGITAESLQTVITAIEDYVNYNDCDGITGYDGLVYAIQPENRSITYLNGLYVAVSSAFPAEFKDALSEQGLTIDDLIDTVLQLADLDLVMGLTLTDSLKEQARDIFEQKIVNQSVSITLEKLAENGLTFENLQSLIDSLSEQDKTFLRSVIWTLGYLGEPEAAPSTSEYYYGPVTVTLTSATPEAVIYYTLDGVTQPWESGAIAYTVPITLNRTTTIIAAAYADGVYSEEKVFVYNVVAGAVTGTVHLEGLQEGNFGGVTVQIYDSLGCPEGNSVTTDSTGAYTLSNIAAGNYTLMFSASKYLKKKATDVVVEAGETTTVDSVTMLTGDANGDNQIDLSDVGKLATAYGSISSDLDYDINCDFNNDGRVELVDLGWMAVNYGLSGDQI